MNQSLDSKPHLTGFNPFIIPSQANALKFLREETDHRKGTPEILLSGSYGSSKSILMAHIAVTHCLFYPGARVLIGRRSRPDLKRTIFKEILDHIEPDLKEDRDYVVNNTSHSIYFRNHSEIISVSWADKRYTKVRSLKLSGIVIEELTENDDEAMHLYMEAFARLRRIPDIPENFTICATNPGSPASIWHKYFIQKQTEYRKTFYSLTAENPFLDPQYIEGLRQNLDPKAARRYLYGEWIELNDESIYYQYQRDIHFKPFSYQVDPFLPVHINWDFNIGLGKPLSACLFQVKDGHVHVFSEVILDQARTSESCEEMLNRGFLNQKTIYCLHGDAAGNARSTKSTQSDWEIIRKFFDNQNLNYRFEVPQSNPPIRKRHNTVNAYCKNDLGQVRISVYKDAPTVDEALRLTMLKKGSQYLEDDSKRFQHVGTALGYGLVWVSDRNQNVKIQTQER